jgi:hypothetical protein
MKRNTTTRIDLEIIVLYSWISCTLLLTER